MKQRYQFEEWRHITIYYSILHAFESVDII